MLTKNAQVRLYSGLYLPSNGTIANVVHHDLDLQFQGQTFSHFAFTIKYLRRQQMSLVDLPRLAWPAVQLHTTLTTLPEDR